MFTLYVNHLCGPLPKLAYHVNNVPGKCLEFTEERTMQCKY